jgi:ectoine hydroxylase-related dioxygenase (phytanoyl-CoA dioxygenase family)
VDAPLQPLDPKFAVTENKWLTQEQVKMFRDTGVLLLRAAQIWTPVEHKLLLDSVNEMDKWPEQAGKWMKYYEKNLLLEREKELAAKQGRKVDASKFDGRLLQRIENFTQFNKGMDLLLNGAKLLGMCSELFGELAVLYKEKINYKLPGGAGFAPHQDVSAGWWMYGQSLHVSCLITIDEATVENGCLEIVYGQHKRGRLAPDWKEIPTETVRSLEWVSLPTSPGDVCFFDSYVPHRSGPNMTSRPRRVLYATYAKLSEGDWRQKYYADKRASFPPDIEREQGKVYEYKI